MQKGDPAGLARRLFSPLPQRYDLLAEVLSFGQNGRWRRAMVDRVASREIDPYTAADQLLRKVFAD